MASPFIGAITMFGGNFAPRGYAFCSGQIQSIAQNTALFSLIGTTYGGNGQTTFALPNLQGRFPISQGQGPGLSNRTMGEVAGTESVTLITNQIPQHTHAAVASAAAGTTQTPSGKVWAGDPSGDVAPYNTAVPNAIMAASALGTTGGSQPHPNVQPFLCINFVIALEGIFPSRN